MRLSEGAITDAITELRPSRDTVDAKRQALTARIRALDEEHGRYVAAIVIAAQWKLLAHLLGPITITEDLGRC